MEVKINPHHEARKNLELLEMKINLLTQEVAYAETFESAKINVRAIKEYIKEQANKDVMPVVFRRALDTYGLEAQLGLLQEECAELIQAVSKYKRGRSHNIAEEIADVTIMIEQIVHSMHLKEDVDVIRAEKMDRLDKRLEAI